MVAAQLKYRPRASSAAAAPWIAHRERGSALMMRFMAFVSLRLGRRISRIVLYGIAAYFLVFAPTARGHMRRYLRRALAREPTGVDRYRLLLSFASTIHDRLYFICNRFDEFEISVDGSALIAARTLRGEGAILMGAHLGSFEATRALGQRQPGLQVALAMYEDNARKISALLAAVNPGLALDIISLGTMDSMLQIRSRLDAGAFVGVLGDRSFGAERCVRLEFLGAPAHFPTSAMRAAAILRRPVIFMAGLYRGANRYHIVFEELADFSQSTASNREQAIHIAIARYATVLERYCLSDPFNWFNFFDFWQELPAVTTSAP